ncbi:MAG: hypothetical protein JWO03_3257 [Bacteroidetes bacterium]|nr:hypothetical protein [Bacteroidota bacterium]
MYACIISLPLFSLFYVMKHLIVLSLLLLSVHIFAQKGAPARSAISTVSPKVQLSKSDLSRMVRLEDSLQKLMNIVLYDSTVRVVDKSIDYAGAVIRSMASGKDDSTVFITAPAKVDSNSEKRRFEKRKTACYQFIPKLISALKMDNSFYYPFDSLQEVSKVYPPDSSFRILTWQMHYPKGRFRYYGVIQMRSQKMKIYPLRDLRDTLPFHTQRVLTKDNWYGQIYYRIIERTYAKKTYYTLFGFEAADFISRRKIVDILTFDADGSPRFGAPLFCSTDSSRYKIRDTLSRFFIEYKWSASPTLNYDNNKDMIVYDHLAPPNPKANGVYMAYAQDGTYEGYKWKTNHWEWVEKVFNFAINENDNPPIPAPLFGIPKKQPNLPQEVEH